MIRAPGVDRVVVYRLGSLGDTVVALPSLHAVERAFPDAERIMLTNIPVSSKAAPLEAILGGSGLVHRFIAYPVGTRSFGALAALRRTLLDVNARTLVYLTPSRGLKTAYRDLLYFRLCGFERIIGMPGTPALQRNERGVDGYEERESERLVRCIAEIGPVNLDDPDSWNLRLSKMELGAGTRLLEEAAGQPRIAINMGGKVLENDWGEPNWEALFAALGPSLSNHALVFVGGPEDAQRADRASRQWPGTAVNLCGKASPRVSAAAMTGARLFVGHDSGPLHLASCVAVPCVGLFGDHDRPRKYHPYGRAHHIIHEPRGVMKIQVSQVVDAVARKLADATTREPL